MTKKRGIVRRTYDWVIDLADSPYGAWALFLLAFAESSFFPVPPDVLLMALAIGASRRSLWFATIATVGSLLGGMFGYYIGYALWYSAGEYSAIANFFFQNVPGITLAKFESVKHLYHAYGFWVVFVAGFTPIPYKIFTIFAGISHISFPVFILASSVSRAGRFFLVGGLFRLFGPSIKAFVDRWFNWVAIAFTVLLIGGFYVIRFLH